MSEEQVIDDHYHGPIDEDIADKIKEEVAITEEDITAGITDPDVEGISEKVIEELKETEGIDKGQSTYVDPAKKGTEMTGIMSEASKAKTLGTSDQNECKKVVPDVKMFGDDLFKLLSKASSQKEG